jgi:UDP-N-acetylmuramate--alanine ligase
LTTPRRIHFVGIAGVGMSGLAELMCARGAAVSGSDLAGGRIVDHLRALGMEIALGHDAANIDKADVVVVSTAIKSDNPEVAAARTKGTPVIHRSELLAEAMNEQRGIAISGTHGKTTTTALVAHLLVRADLDPTALVGGALAGEDGLRSGAVIGTSPWFVTEADESDGSFLRLSPHIAVVTNIDADHLDHYGDMAGLEDAFRRFTASVPEDGLCVICSDHPATRALADRMKGRVVRYGVEPGADLVARTSQADGFEVLRDGTHVGRAVLPLPGAHNIANALAALAVGFELDIDFDVMREALASFRGVARRFERKGEANGVQVVDDYGHHPVEVRATLEAARTSHEGRVVTVFQPHRYTRTRDLLAEFSRAFGDCDMLIIADTYAAGEAPIEGAEASTLAAAIERDGHANVRFIASLDDIADTVAGEVCAGDLVLTLGAGNVTELGPMLLDRLGGNAGGAGAC